MCADLWRWQAGNPAGYPEGATYRRGLSPEASAVGDRCCRWRWPADAARALATLARGFQGLRGANSCGKGVLDRGAPEPGGSPREGALLLSQSDVRPLCDGLEGPLAPCWLEKALALGTRAASKATGSGGGRAAGNSALGWAAAVARRGGTWGFGSAQASSERAAALVRRLKLHFGNLASYPNKKSLSPDSL